MAGLDLLDSQSSVVFHPSGAAIPSICLLVRNVLTNVFFVEGGLAVVYEMHCSMIISLLYLVLLCISANDVLR